MTDKKMNEEDKLEENLNEEDELESSNDEEKEVQKNKESRKDKKLKKQLEEKEKEAEEYKEQLLRLQADFMNFKRRSEKSKQDTITYAIESFVSDILPILDNFERALESNKDSESSFAKGVNLIYTDLKKLLEKNNVEKIEALNQEFDPNLHHAVFMEESQDHEENIVIEVLQTGYKMKDKVIRPAMVKVSK